MLAEERWNEILMIVTKEKTVTVPELVTALGASESTVRRDLVQLAKMKKLIRVHGGATCIETEFVPADEAYSAKIGLMNEEKARIASYAVKLIGPDDFVYVDAGTTTEALTDAVSENGAVFVTNSIGNAERLLRKGCRVILPGGELKNSTEALVGAETVDAIRKFHFTIGFFGTNGISEENGFTTPEVNEAAVKRTAMEMTEQRYVLADHTKFSRVAPVSFAALTDAQVITDRIPDRRYAKYRNIISVGNTEE